VASLTTRPERSSTRRARHYVPKAPQFSLPAFGIFFEEKTVKGCKYGSAQVRRDFPRFVDLIETHRLDISAMVSKTIKLDGVNDAFRAMEAGEVVRSVIT
jgi:S-(hydroxymethyl)glutathione dehydrogenase / alcohol dehydrogenase